MSDVPERVKLDYLNNFDPTTRCWALVGALLGYWAFLEETLKNAIAKALGLTLIQSVIVTSNIQFRDKIHILKTAVDVSGINPKEDREEFKSLLNKIANHYVVRNLLAHTAFGPTDDGKHVRFFITRAKGELSAEQDIWTISRFEDEIAIVREFDDRTHALISRLDRASLVTAILRARFAQPTSKSPSLGFGDILGLPLQSPPDSDRNPASDQTASQNPPKPEK